MGVYLIKAGDFVKIGVAKCPKNRLKQLQTGSPYKLELLDFINVKNEYEIENILHQKLNKYHILNEWFQSKDDVINIFKELKIKYNDENNIIIKSITRQKEVTPFYSNRYKVLQQIKIKLHDDNLYLVNMSNVLEFLDRSNMEGEPYFERFILGNGEEVIVKFDYNTILKYVTLV